MRAAQPGWSMVAASLTLALSGCGTEAADDVRWLSTANIGSPSPASRSVSVDRWSWSSYKVAPDDRTLTLTLPSAGLCEQFSHTEVRYADEPTGDGAWYVRVEVYAEYPLPLSPERVDCLKPEETITARVLLDQPLGGWEVTQRYRGTPPIPPDANSGSLPPATSEPR